VLSFVCCSILSLWYTRYVLDFVASLAAVWIFNVNVKNLFLGDMVVLTCTLCDVAAEADDDDDDDDEDGDSK